MKDKEERLSPVAKRLLEDTRKRFSHSTYDAIKKLRSVNPQKLTMYDRQKIGREILSRSPGVSILFTEWDLEKFQNEIQSNYDLPLTKFNMDSGKYEPLKPLIGEYRIRIRLEAINCEREMIKNMDFARNHPRRRERFYDGSTFESIARDNFYQAVKSYALLEMSDKVTECYNLRIKDMEEQIERSGPDSWLERNINALKKRKDNFPLKCGDYK